MLGHDHPVGTERLGRSAAARRSSWGPAPDRGRAGRLARSALRHLQQSIQVDVLGGGHARHHALVLRRARDGRQLLAGAEGHLDARAASQCYDLGRGARRLRPGRRSRPRGVRRSGAAPAPDGDPRRTPRSGALPLPARASRSVLDPGPHRLRARPGSRRRGAHSRRPCASSRCVTKASIRAWVETHQSAGPSSDGAV